MLAGKRLLITGLVTTDSIAFAVAERAQLMGARLILTAFPRDLERAQEAAAALPAAAPMFDLDVTDPGGAESLTEALRAEGQTLDGALHAVAFAPRDALSGDLLRARPESVGLAFQTSAVSYAALARILADLHDGRPAAIVGLDFDAAGAWPVYNWMGVCKAALESVSRYVARDLGPRGIRSNLVAAGPIHTRAAAGIGGFDELLSAWELGAPLRWDPQDAAPVADATCFLFSDLARAITGEILHVDGGYHAMAAPLSSADRAAAVVA